MTIYVGVRYPSGCMVLVNDHDLDPRLDLVSHSPTGFEWGYSGSGPGQLALALLAHAVGDKLALEWYSTFEWDVVKKLPASGWVLHQSAIREWLQNQLHPLQLADAS